MAELHPEAVDVPLVLGQLPTVVGLDPVAGEAERIERPSVAGGVGRADLVDGYAQADLGEVKPVEFLGQLHQRLVAAGGDIGDDRARGLFDIDRSLALGVEKRLEALGKIARARIETDWHALFIKHPPLKREGRLKMPRAGRSRCRLSDRRSGG